MTVELLVLVAILKWLNIIIILIKIPIDPVCITSTLCLYNDEEEDGFASDQALEESMSPQNAC